MGYHLLKKIAPWTFLCSLWMLVFSEENTLFEDLGLGAFPDVAKINVSQDEYAHMMTLYLDRLKTSEDPDTIPRLLTFNSGELSDHYTLCANFTVRCTSPYGYHVVLQDVCERKMWKHRKDEAVRVRFPVKTMESFDLESAELRLLAPAVPGQQTVTVQVYQVLSARRRKFLEEQQVFVSSVSPKWCEFDVSKSMRNWMKGERNLGLELECMECANPWKPLKAALSALVHPKATRHKRSAYQHQFNQGRTDCRAGDTKKRCCRHEMHVTFTDLKLSLMGQIVQPKKYEAGFCKGRCPPNFNYATNHSRIQSLVHKIDKKSTPRVCCAPSKLESLDILRVDPFNNTKLTIEKWDNMKVIECACS